MSYRSQKEITRASGERHQRQRQWTTPPNRQADRQRNSPTAGSSLQLIPQAKEGKQRVRPAHRSWTSFTHVIWASVSSGLRHGDHRTDRSAIHDDEWNNDNRLTDAPAAAADADDVWRSTDCRSAVAPTFKCSTCSRTQTRGQGRDQELEPRQSESGDRISGCG